MNRIQLLVTKLWENMILELLSGTFLRHEVSILSKWWQTSFFIKNWGGLPARLPASSPLPRLLMWGKVHCETLKQTSRTPPPILSRLPVSHALLFLGADVTCCAACSSVSSSMGSFPSFVWSSLLVLDILFI